MCDSPEWLNGLSNPVSESYHPNRTGHASGYTPLVSPKLTGAVVAATAATLRAARASATTLAARSGRYAARDRPSGRSGSWRPTCTARGPAARRQGRRRLESRASVDRADRTYSRQQAKAWAARH